jgi:hypothetical protein
MDEFENYAENIHEHSNEHAEHAANHGGGKDKWVVWVAMTTAVIAVLAAITGLLAGDHADEAMLSQIHASDQWAFYQAKGIKSDVIASADKLMLAVGKKASPQDSAKIASNKTEQADIMKEAKAAEKESKEHSAKHKILARGVTLFQIAIAIGAISIIVKRKALWMTSMGFAAIEIFFLLQGTVF